MGLRLLPLAILAGAAAAHAAGQPILALYLFVAAVPATAGAALVALGDLVERPGALILRVEAAAAALALFGLLAAAVVARVQL